MNMNILRYIVSLTSYIFDAVIVKYDNESIDNDLHSNNRNHVSETEIGPGTGALANQFYNF